VHFGPNYHADGAELPFNVAEWLDSIGLHQYLDNFERQGFDNLRVVQELTPEDLEVHGLTP
jgi:hypothetical protein